MNKKMQRITTAGLALLIGSGLFVTSVDAASLSKSIKAVYNNIKVAYDGNMATPNNEPFMVDGTVYVSLRDVGQITGNTVDWRNNTVYITPGAGSTNQSALDQKQREVDFWKTKSDALEKQLADLKNQGTTNGNGTVVKPGDLNATLKGLEDYYQDEYGVDWAFNLKQDSRKNILYFNVSYESKYDSTPFGRISDSKMETFLKDMCEDIQTAFTGFTIEGELEDDTKGTILKEFTYSDRGRLTITKSISKDDIRDLEDTLQARYTRLPALTTGGFKDMVISISDVALSGKDDYESVYFELDVNIASGHSTDWNSLSRSDERALEDYMETIADYITDKLGVSYVDGYIMNGSKVLVKYEDGYLTLNSF